MGETPEIRFDGFTDAWEQRKSGDIAPLRGGFAFKSNEYCSEGVPIVRISNILSDGSVGSDFAYYNEQNYDEVYTLYDGAAVLAMSGATTGKVSVLYAEKGQKYYQNQRVGYFVPTDICEYSFIRTIMRSQLFADQLSAVLVAGAQPNVSSKEIDGFEFMIPKSKDEQRWIGEYFQSLDNLITLHQRKYEKLQVMKKSMLEKMFPKQGSNVPEIRFDGFTDAWEQRKLGEVVERIVRKNENLESTLPLTISAQHGLIDQNEFFDKRIASKDVSGYYLVRKGEFAYNKSTSSDAPWGAIKRLDRYESGVLSTLYIVFRILDEEKACSDYLVTYYSTDLWHKGVQAIAAEGARNHGLLNIAPADFFETDLMLPNNIAEQQKIGAYFSNLDHLITLHQHKYEKLLECKKAFLTKMFGGES